MTNKLDIGNVFYDCRTILFVGSDIKMRDF